MQSGATPVRITEVLPPSPYGSFSGAPRCQQQVSAKPAGGAGTEQQVLHSGGQAGQQLQQEQLTAAREDLAAGEHVQGHQEQLTSERQQRPVQQAGQWLPPQQLPAGLQDPHARGQEGQQPKLGQSQPAEDAAQGNAGGDLLAARGAADASRANASDTAGSGLPEQAAAAAEQSNSPLPENLCCAQTWQPPGSAPQPAEGHSALPAAVARQQQVTEEGKVALVAAQRDRQASAERPAAHAGPAEEASAEPLPPSRGQEQGSVPHALGRASSPQQANTPGAWQREASALVEPALGNHRLPQEPFGWGQESAGLEGGPLPSPQLASPPVAGHGEATAPVEPALGDSMPLQQLPSWGQDQAGAVRGTPPSPQMAGPSGATRLTRRQPEAPAPVDPASAEYRLAQERASAARAACDLLRGRPKTSNEDPYFMDSYYRSVVGLMNQNVGMTCAECKTPSPHVGSHSWDLLQRGGTSQHALPGLLVVLKTTDLSMHVAHRSCCTHVMQEHAQQAGSSYCMEVATVLCGSSYQCVSRQINNLSQQLRGLDSLMAAGLQGS